jgi:hypothetical protein
VRHIAKKHDSELIGEPEVGSVADAHSCCILTTLDGEIFDAAKKKGGGECPADDWKRPPQPPMSICVAGFASPQFRLCTITCV